MYNNFFVVGPLEVSSKFYNDETLTLVRASLYAGIRGHIRIGFDIVNFLETRKQIFADKWAIQALVPVAALDDAIAQGCTEIWELADHFGVTEDFMRKAICYYVHGNVAAELYF